MRTLFRFGVYRETQEVLTWPLDMVVGLGPGPLPQQAASRPEAWCDVQFVAPNQAALPVPRGTAPIFDGTLSAGEWAGAQEVAPDDRTTLFLKHGNGELFLGLSARTMGGVSPCVVRGDDVWVLHASAALGTAIYQESGDAWARTQDFTWSRRSTGFDEEALQERAAFFAREGWLGTLGYLGIRAHFEYRIDLLGEDSLTILFLFLDLGHPRKVLSRPVDLSDVPDATALVTGPVPETMPFDISTWILLMLEGGE